MKANDEAMKVLSTPVMPADLPVDDGDGTTPKPKDETKAVNPLYTMQYGDEDTAVKAVLNDLHGADYEQKRWNQRVGFVRYLRTGFSGRPRRSSWR